MVVLLFTLLNFNCNYETNSSSNGFFDLYIERETTVTGTSKSIINGFCDLMHHK